MGFVPIDGFDAIGMHKCWMSITVESASLTKKYTFCFTWNKMNVSLDVFIEYILNINRIFNVFIELMHIFNNSNKYFFPNEWVQQLKVYV